MFSRLAEVPCGKPARTFRVAVAFTPDVADGLATLLPAGTEATLLRARLLVGRRAYTQAVSSRLTKQEIGALSSCHRTR